MGAKSLETGGDIGRTIKQKSKATVCAMGCVDDVKISIKLFPHHASKSVVFIDQWIDASKVFANQGINLSVKTC
jgi:hypothetical protein